MEPADKIRSLIEKASVTTSSGFDEGILEDAYLHLERLRQKKSTGTQPDLWRIITKRPVAKLAAVAMIIIVLSVGLMHLLTGGAKHTETVKIPPELAQMPVEQLLEIHFGRRQSIFGSELVEAAAERAISRLSARQIIALTTGLGSPAGDANAAARKIVGAHTVAPPPAPPPPLYLWSTAGFSDLIVQARVDRVEIDANDARAAILEKRGKWVKVRGIEEFVARIKGTVQLDVRAAYPASVVEAGEPLVVDAVFCTTQRAGHIEQGKEYLVALKRQGQTMSMWANRGRLYTRQDGVYVVDSNSETVSGFPSYGSMPLDHTWQYIMDAYDAIHERVLPPPEVQDYWLTKLQSDDLIDCWTAVDYFAALVRFCWLPKLQSYEIVDGLTAVEYLNILTQTPVESQAVAEAVERQVKMRPTYGFVKDAFDLLIKLGDPSTNERMVEIYKRERLLDDSIFSEHAVGNYNTIISRIRSFVPSKSPEAEKSLQAVLDVVKSGLAAEDNGLIPFLAEILTRHSQIPRLIATQTPDPCFVPVLREAIEHKYSGDLVWALYACGRQEEAVRIASEHVHDYLSAPKKKELSPARHYSMWRTIRFLGTSDSEATSDILESLTYADSFIGPQGNRLQAAAIMAFARVAGERAIEHLRELYATDDYYVRIAAAVSLYHLDDDAGYDLLEHFINHTELTIPEIKKFWHIWIWNLDAGWGRPFHEALLYLRSPQTEELFLERLRNGVRKADMQALEIAREREREVLPILLEHLNNHNRVTRDEANKMLKRLTGQDFGFSPWRYPLAGPQIEAVEQWRAYVDEYLAATEQPTE